MQQYLSYIFLIVSLTLLQTWATEYHRPDPLFEALKRSSFNEVRRLLKQGANPNIRYAHRYYTYALFLALNPKIAQLLVQSGANTSQHNWLGKSLLHHAIDPQIKDGTLFDFYIEHGLRPSSLPCKGATLWHQLVADARWYPAENTVPRAEKLIQLRVPTHTMHPDTGYTPEQLIKRQIKLAQHHFDPAIFGQTRHLVRLLRVLLRR